MKKFASILTVVISMSAMGTAHAAENCATKRTALEREINIAQQFGNSAKVAGLRQALAEVNAHCTSSSVIADAQKDVRKLEKKVAEKQNDIREAQESLRKAQAEGNSKKVAKHQRKLAEKQSDLHELQQELQQARAELASLKK